MSTAIPGPDDKPRCRWCLAAPDFLSYHDSEWGFPVADDHRLFEKLSLECFQSGLKELKRRGWKFVGPTTVYAFMQAMGLVNDHVEGCITRLQVDRARKKFRPPAR